MHQEVFQDPRVPYQSMDGTGYTLQIAAPLGERVPIGHFDMDSGAAIIDEMVSRVEYLDRIQAACAEHGEAYQVRFYQHFEGFDACVLDQLDEVRSLMIDPFCPVDNPGAVGRLPHLTKLGFAPRGRTDPDLLNLMGVQRLHYFLLADSSTPPLDLAPLGEAQFLHTLRLLGQGKNIEAVGTCRSLKELSMQPLEKHALDFISRLPRLEVLKFSLGKRQSIASIENAPSLRDLSVYLVSTLEDLGDLQRFPRLRRLQIEQQKRLKIIRTGPMNTELEHINAEGIDQIDGLTELQALKSLSIFNGKLDVDWSRLPSTLTHFQQMPASLKAREKHKMDVKAKGLIPEDHPDASFFYK